MSLRGTILRIAYLLRRHLWAGWPLSRWLGLLFVAGGLLALSSGWPVFWPSALVAGLYGAYLLLLTWAARKRYVHFQPVPLPPSPQSGRPLRREALVRIRASGWFTVEGRGRYYADLDADFETVGTREHIIMARVYPSRFLSLGRWPADEVGWWYAFFQPAMIRRVDAGRFYFGAQPRLALRVIYAPDEEREEAIYLTFDAASALSRVRNDLLKDTPADVQARAGSEGAGP